MTSYWCALCAEVIPEPEWTTTPRPVPYHLLGRSMHSVQPVEGEERDRPLQREAVVRENGQLRTIEPEEVEAPT